VLIPPRLARFRELTQLGSADLVADFTGWNKYVLVAGDRVFLFPREPASVQWFEHELRVYRALEATGLTVVPRVRREWRDQAVYPFPFAEVTRLPGQRPADPAGMFGQLGETLARCHMVTPPHLVEARPPAHRRQPHLHWLRRALDRGTSDGAAAEAALRLGCPGRFPTWRQRLATAAALGHVLVHGDIHEDQLLASGGKLTGILDWETARVDHPFWDFDLGEWGTGLWRRHRSEFSGLWATAWQAYALTRGLDTDPRPLETAFRLRQALYLLEETGPGPAVTGTIAEHLEYA
jgi:aminoglycoside phosphotransferase (APT) family kinase protein